jgi:putative hemolysin
VKQVNKMIDAESLLQNYIFDQNITNKAFIKTASKILKKILHQDEINNFINTHKHLEGFEFNDAVLKHFNFQFSVSSKDRSYIPDQGRVIIVANHPLGSLDGFSLLKLISEIRTDVKIVATTPLDQIKPMQCLFHSVDNLSKNKNYRKSMQSIVDALESEQAVIIFPTGEVSRIRPNGVRDGKWKSGFLHLAKKTRSPILPVHIKGKNSSLFYGLSSIYKPLGTMMLVNEMFKLHDGEISIRIGKPVPWESISCLDLPKKILAKHMRKQVYLIGTKSKKLLFEPMENIIHPTNTKLIKKELQTSKLIGKTSDGKHIYLFDYRSNSSVIRELGRLRELSFRQVHEGTGSSLDIDSYDRYYRHLILWDEDELEIIGAYRIGEAGKILQNMGKQGLYTHSLFDFSDKLIPCLEQSIELGRSFIQPAYQGKRSLEYLWVGIGAYLQQNPDIKYMFGPVSLSNAYPQAAKQTIAAFYSQLFGNVKSLAEPRMPFSFSFNDDFSEYENTTDEAKYKQAYKILKQKLSHHGVKVPTLYKQYVELCIPGGCEFLGFSIDPDFSKCVDAMILIDVNSIKEKKRHRYIDCHNSVSENTNVA